MHLLHSQSAERLVGDKAHEMAAREQHEAQLPHAARAGRPRSGALAVHYPALPWIHLVMLGRDEHAGHSNQLQLCAGHALQHMAVAVIRGNRVVWHDAVSSPLHCKLPPAAPCNCRTAFESSVRGPAHTLAVERKRSSRAVARKSVSWCRPNSAATSTSQLAAVLRMLASK